MVIYDGVDVISIFLGVLVIDYFYDFIVIGVFYVMDKGIFVVVVGGNLGFFKVIVSNGVFWIFIVVVSFID